MNPSPKKKNRLYIFSAGFTLVELLTVIAIIAILAGIMIPVIRTARVTAYTAADMGRMRSIGAGFALFAGDNGGRFPSNGVGSSIPGARNTRWMFHVGRYMGIGQEATLTLTVNGTSLSYPILQQAYRLAEFHSAFTPPELYDMVNPIHESLGIFGGNGNLLTNADGYGRFGIFLEEVARPAKTILLGERYAGVLGDGAQRQNSGPAVNRTGLFPVAHDGLASNAEIMRRGAEVQQGPVTLLMADFSVQQANIEDLDIATMNRSTSSGIRFAP